MKGPLSLRTSGKAFSSGQKTSSRTISPVIEARKPTLPWIAGAPKPSHPFSSTKPLMSPASSLAHTTKTSAIGLLVIHIYGEAISTRNLACTSDHAAGIGTMIWLGQAKTADKFTGRELRQIFLPCRLVAELVDRHH